MKTLLPLLALIVIFASGCELPMNRPPQPAAWNSINETTEREYESLRSLGSGSISGQAFLTQAGGGVVKGAGSSVNLDPATTIAAEWWNTEVGLWANTPPDWSLSNVEQYSHAKARESWTKLTPPSAGFAKARRTTTADADGRFKFSDLPAGKYYITTTVSWTVGYAYQGGLIGQVIEVTDGKSADVILSHRPRN